MKIRKSFHSHEDKARSFITKTHFEMAYSMQCSETKFFLYHQIQTTFSRTNFHDFKKRITKFRTRTKKVARKLNTQPPFPEAIEPLKM